MKKILILLIALVGITTFDMYTSEQNTTANKIQTRDYAIQTEASQSAIIDGAVLFSGNSNPELAQKVAQLLNLPPVNAIVDKHNDGEIQVQIQESIRKKDLYIIQPTCSSNQQSINDAVMELFLMIRAAKRASAKSITVIMPYYGYARQDRKSAPRVPISAADIALLIETAGADRILTVDLHCGQIQGFFTQIPVDNLYAAQVFIPYLNDTKNLQNVVVVSPDAGGVDRATKFATKLAESGINSNMALINKKRAGAGKIESMDLIGDVKNADVIIVDDLCDTGGTLIKAAELLKNNGAKRVFAVITHPVFSNDALKKIKNSVIDEVIISDSIPLKNEKPSNVTVVSISSLLAEAIKCIHLGTSMSKLFM
ncbi:MAG: Ribose-phosphate pyrophosphokinase [candidate division TM6 bacterium GW2011_GWF2_32_72]|nr:MAG: Ribose-phosphate pyrophosphokinase [candidate division TM6 bacterium GW2011_GWF2_32_72]